MASERVELNASVVKDSLKLALKGMEGIEDYCDRLQPYLVLRVRGHVASWLVKTRDRSIKIGDAMPPDKAARIPERRKRASKSGDEYLGLREARDRARREWAKLGNRVDSPEEKPCWTWGRLVEEYKDYLSEMREDESGKPVYPSAETQSDVRQIFARPAVAGHTNRPLSELNEDWFEDVQKELHETYNYHAYRKFRAYASAALKYAQEFKRKESGIGDRKWWLLAEKRRRTSKEVTAKMARDKALADKKNAFKVEHLGELLARHERFCLSRSGNERVSPSVRWGMWWDILTGHRRGSGTRLAYEDVEFKDPRGDAGWGLATWQADVMKTQNPFTLPIPPLGLHIIRCCTRDWTQAAERAGIWNRKSRWVFASRVLQSEKGDIPVGGSAFATHIYNMRGLRQDNHRDVLSGIPDFSMHLIRSTLGDFILEHTELPPGTASLFISHEIAGDRKSELDRVGQTGKRWYFQAQRIPEKTKAMEAWSQALLRAFFDAGGIYPS